MMTQNRECRSDALLGKGTETAITFRSLRDLIGTCVALGADGFGGPLSRAEAQLVTRFPKRSVFGANVAEAIRAGKDPLGDALCALRPSVKRRSLGAFYTPSAIVETMVRWALGQKPVRLIDPGCGTGRFAAEAIRHDSEVPVVAIDVDPVATLACRATLAVLKASHARVVNRDYLAVSRDWQDGRTAFVGNPPYVRHHSLSSVQKRWAKEAASRLGLSVSGLSGLHVYFFLATLLLAKPGDTGCFITSAEWLDVGYGSVLRKALLNGMGGVGLCLLDRERAVFEDAMTTALITCFEVSREVSSIRIQHLRARRSVADLNGGRLVGSGRLAESKRWTPFFVVKRSSANKSALVPLGSLVRVSRGIATGCNGFFLLTEDEARRRGIVEYTVPALASAEDVLRAEGVVTKGTTRLVLLAPRRDIDLADEHHVSLRHYLAEGKKRHVADAYLCRHRSPWWWLGEPKTPPIVATYMARQAPAFACNPDGLSIVNVLHGLYPKVALDAHALASLVRFLNSNRDTFRGLGRVYQGGLEKFEPGEMEAIPVPALERLRLAARL
jgi:adenine-specific DNA-methyltransferase